jgi:hypothetical protein
LHKQVCFAKLKLKYTHTSCDSILLIFSGDFLVFYVSVLLLLGAFFAAESILWPSYADSSPLYNSTPMVMLSAVIVSVVSEIGFGFDPAFTIPGYV